MPTEIPPFPMWSTTTPVEISERSMFPIPATIEGQRVLILAFHFIDQEMTVVCAGDDGYLLHIWTGMTTVRIDPEWVQSWFAPRPKITNE